MYIVATIDKLALVAQQSVEHAAQHLCCRRALAAFIMETPTYILQQIKPCNAEVHLLKCNLSYSAGERPCGGCFPRHYRQFIKRCTKLA